MKLKIDEETGELGAFRAYINECTMFNLTKLDNSTKTKITRQGNKYTKVYQNIHIWKDDVSVTEAQE